ncbi:hypothetical protein Ahy_B05g073776 isoform B [Arachis hypogaea]|uniref:Dehydrogenase/reductase SDR family member 12 n=1 Tax=Arachis hypogaea TaxID=3818 RepID=A0A444YWY6_ARAHY|nr:hypothetical protein Ahy_B05g073776 isoform B [Arachis hypogaea]
MGFLWKLLRKAVSWLRGKVQLGKQRDLHGQRINGIFVLLTQFKSYEVRFSSEFLSCITMSPSKHHGRYIVFKWDQLDSVYQYKWNFSNLENAFEEGGVLHGKKVYLFGCTEPQQVCFKDVEKVILVPIIVAIEVSNIYLELHPKEGCFETFKVGSSMSIACHVSNFYHPLKEDELEQSTEVQILFPTEPKPVFCSFDWKFNDLEEFSDELIKDEELSADRKHEFKTWRSTAFGVYGYLNFTKPAYLDHAKKFKPGEMDIQITGKNCIVTGANSGIGYATAEGLARRGATVYLVCRNKERGEAALSEIQTKTGNQNVHLEICDLSSVADIKSFASRFSKKNMPVHVLVNNAGLLEQKRVTTSEGFELNFAVNVLGTYAMTESMVPLLEKASPDARVITVSSGGMYTTPLTKDLQFSGSNFDGVEQYARNKRVQVALTEKWAETYKDKGIGFYSMHPGWAETPGVAKSLPSFNEKLAGKLRTREEGADTVVWLALQPKEKLVSGAFYFDRAEAPKHLPLAATSGSHTLINSLVEDLHSIVESISVSPTQIHRKKKMKFRKFSPKSYRDPSCMSEYSGEHGFKFLQLCYDAELLQEKFAYYSNIQYTNSIYAAYK